MQRRRLPIGISSFDEIRSWNFYYVDKTPHILNLVEYPGRYFLSRPRRFGKSLLIDTMAELFRCNEKLFQGLYIHDRWDWDNPHPVLFFSFGSGSFSKPGGLELEISDKLAMLEDKTGIDPDKKAHSVPTRLNHLVEHLHVNHSRQNKVVILVDEYDKPILDVIEQPELAEANRDTLREFYSAIKDSDRHVRFTFVAGISMFAQVSLFSGPNHLTDISLTKQYSSICGYTESDLDTVFAPELEGLDREQVRKWYNGYSWFGTEKVYNPYDIMLYFNDREFRPYWIRTGTPRSLFKTLVEQHFHPLMLENLEMTEEDIAKFEIHNISLIAFLFQAGYLTISERCGDFPITYKLDYPNLEVSQALNNGLLEMLSGKSGMATGTGLAMSRSLMDNDFPRFSEVVKSLFASLPHQSYRVGHNANSSAGHERTYSTYLVGCCRGAGLKIQAEVSSVQGDADLVLWLERQIFIFEFKVAANANKSAPKLAAAMQQIKDKKYYEPYLQSGKLIHLVGMVFGKAERNLVALDFETIPV